MAQQHGLLLVRPKTPTSLQHLLSNHADTPTCHVKTATYLLGSTLSIQSRNTIDVRDENDVHRLSTRARVTHLVREQGRVGILKLKLDATQSQIPLDATQSQIPIKYFMSAEYVG